MSLVRFQPNAQVNTQQKTLFRIEDPRNAVRAACAAVEIDIYRIASDGVDHSRYPDLLRRALRVFQLQQLAAPEDAVDFVDDLCELAINQTNANFSAALERLYNRGQEDSRLPATGMAYLRRIARKILLNLWAAEAVLLPITVPLRSGDDVRSGAVISAPVYNFCANFENLEGSQVERFRMRNHITAWLPSTTWTRPDRVTIQGALDVNHFLNDCFKGRVDFSAPKAPPGVGLLLRCLLHNMPSLLSYDDDDLKLFDLHFARRLGPGVPFLGIQSALAERDKPSARKKDRAKRKQNVRTERLTSLAEISVGGEASIAAAQAMIHDIGRSRIGWWPDMSDYSFLDITLSDEAKALWGSLFDRYLSFRREKGMEDERPPELALRCLADYIAVAVPIWASQCDMPIKPPGTPASFRRGLLVDPRDPKLKPASLLTYVRKRYSADSAYSVLLHIWNFFQFIALNYGDDADIAGPHFANPVSKEFDLPRVRGARSRGTNKLPFGKTVLPHLILWLYAVESFGRYIRERGIELPLKRSIVDTEEFGYVPIYWHMNRPYPILRVSLTIIRPQTGRVGASLTVLRLLLFVLETGLRFQGAQWLCKRQFDRANIGMHVRDVAHLHVNTDKVGPPFNTVMLSRVRDLLLREKADQDSCGIEDREIYYAEREHTRFAPLVPLFRDVNTGQPVSDQVYDLAWTWMLRCFQTHIRPVHPVVLVRPKAIKAQSQARERGGSEYCPLSYQRLYTPHSARSTFITRRSPFVPLGDLASLVGQASGRVAAHYNHPEPEEIHNKLLYGEKTMRSPDPAPIRSGPAYIKAGAENSALARSLGRNREGTIASYGMVSLHSILHSGSAASTGLQLLRTSPMSQIVFRATHLCPVGENCPTEVLAITKQPLRCGGCPLACRTVDHLPAIGAKQRLLEERIQANQALYRRLEADGDSDGDLGEVYDTIDADIHEYLGWRISEEVLEEARKNLGPSSEFLHVEDPEIVQLHLTRVVKPSSEQEFVLSRVLDATAYPSMATDRLRLMAVRLRKRILAGLTDVEPPNDEDHDEIAELASLVKVALKAKGATLQDLAASIENHTVPRGSRPRLEGRGS